MCVQVNQCLCSTNQLFKWPKLPAKTVQISLLFEVFGQSYCCSLNSTWCYCPFLAVLCVLFTHEKLISFQKKKIEKCSSFTVVGLFFGRIKKCFSSEIYQEKDFFFTYSEIHQLNAVSYPIKHIGELIIRRKNLLFHYEHTRKVFEVLLVNLVCWPCRNFSAKRVQHTL